MEVKASLNFARIGEQKARLVADLVRGMDVNKAITALTTRNEKAAGLFKKLIESAVANAENKKLIDVDNLFVRSVWVDQGPRMKRFRPRAQGRAFMVRKKMSHMHVVLDEK